MKHRPSNKAETPFKPVPYEVKDVKGTMVTAKNGDHKVTRNILHFKKISEQCGEFKETIDSDEDDVVTVETVAGETKKTEVCSAPRRSTRERKAPDYLIDYDRS